MKAFRTILVFAVAAALTLLVGCAKNDDLSQRVDDLAGRVDALEKVVNEINKVTIPGMQSIVAAIQGNIYVSSVTPGSNGYTITFSNGSTADITNGSDGVDGEKGDKGDTPVVGVIEVDGEFYWAVDGKPLVDSKGNKIPVYSATPQLRIKDGKWQISYDKGQTWADVDVLGNPGGSTISIEDGDTTVTFIINGEAYTIQKELPFYLVFDARKDLGVPVGDDEYTYSYSLKGVSDGDEVEVDILNCTAGWEARVITLPKGSVPGYIGVKHKESSTGKVFVYASNGRGKTDIKSLVFEDGVLTAEADVKPVPAEGGDVTVSVTTNMDYELYVDRSQKWISLAPKTKATHTDVYTLTCEANATGTFRSAEVDVINTVTGEAPIVYYVLQYPAATVSTDITSLENVADNSAVILYKETVLGTCETSAVVSDGTSCLYVTGVKSALPLGKEITLNGVKKTDEETGIVSVELTSYEVSAETSSVTAPQSSYIGWLTTIPAYVVTSGKLEQEGNSFFITAPMGQKVLFESPLASFGIASLVGSYVNVYGYVTSSVYVNDDDGAETCSMILTAISKVEFKENTAWTLSYSIDPNDSEYPEVITNTVSGSTVPYSLGLYSAEAYAELGGDPAKAALRLSDDLLFYYDLYDDYGRDVLYELLVHATGATGSDSFSEKDYGKYVAVAAGILADGTLTGDYKIFEFEKKLPVSNAVYTDYLGQWGAGESVLTVSEKVAGSTYNVTGLPKQNDYGLSAVEAEFSDGKFILKEQKLPGAWYNSNYGDCDVYLCGRFTQNNKSYCAYGWNTEEPSVILTGYLNEETGNMTVVCGSCDYGKFTTFNLSWKIQSGENAGRGNFWPTVQIADLTKLNESSDAFKAWLGNYTLSTKSHKTGADTTYNVALSELVPDKMMAMSGLGIDGFPITYDAASDKCSVVFGKFESSSSYEFYASGLTNDNFVCTGDPTTGHIAVLTKAADKAISIENVVYSLSEERSEVYAQYWGILGKSLSTGKWSLFRDCNYIYNHATMTPTASTKAVKSLSASQPEMDVRFDVKALPYDMRIITGTELRKSEGKKVDARVEKSGRATLLKLK